MKSAVILTYEGNPFVISIFRFSMLAGLDGAVELLIGLVVVVISDSVDTLLIVSLTLNYVEFSG